MWHSSSSHDQDEPQASATRVTAWLLLKSDPTRTYYAIRIVLRTLVQRVMVSATTQRHRGPRSQGGYSQMKEEKQEASFGYDCRL